MRHEILSQIATSSSACRSGVSQARSQSKCSSASCGLPMRFRYEPNRQRAMADKGLIAPLGRLVEHLLRHARPASNCPCENRQISFRLERLQPGPSLRFARPASTARCQCARQLLAAHPVQVALGGQPGNLQQPFDLVRSGKAARQPGGPTRGRTGRAPGERPTSRIAWRPASCRSARGCQAHARGLIVPCQRWRQPWGRSPSPRHRSLPGSRPVASCSCARSTASRLL